MLEYSDHIDINVPIEKVADLFGDHNNAKYWQPSLLRMEHVSGEPRHTGAVHKLYHKMGRREVEMTETLELVDPPHHFVAIYEADKVWNRFACEFSDNEDGSTRWHMNSEFQCGGVARLMMIFAPWMFKNQTRKDMNSFKEWAESL